jgi:Zn-finger nucleic acid-binding protein
MADTLKPLTCPACGKTMEKVFIPSQGINIDICTDGCGGIFFDNREFDKFDEKNEDISAIIAKIEGKTFSKPNESMTRVCPNCGAKMVKNHSSVKQQIEIDECYTCGGRFLDNSELVKIREEYENNEERDEDILRYVYQKVGHQLAEQERKYSEIGTHDKTYVRKFFDVLTRHRS